MNMDKTFFIYQGYEESILNESMEFFSIVLYWKTNWYSAFVNE